MLNGKGRKIGNGYTVFAHAAGSWEDVTHVPAAHISYLFWSRREVQPKLPWQHLHCSKPLSFALVQVCSHLLSNSSMSTLFSHTHSSPSTISLAATGVLMLDVHLIPISTNTIIRLTACSSTTGMNSPSCTFKEKQHMGEQEAPN